MNLNTPLFSGRYKVPNKRFFWGWATLYADRLELRGLGLSGWYRMQIPLAEIREVIWWTGHEDCNFEIQTNASENLGLLVRAAGRLKFAIDNQAAVVSALGARMALAAA